MGFSLKPPTVVIFDMDGTAVRHLDPWVLHLCERYDDLAFRITKFFGWVFRRHGKGPIVPRNDPDKPGKRKRLIVHRTIHKLRRKPVEQIVEPCPGIFGVLNLLRKHDIPMALVSNGLGKGYGHDILLKFGLEDYFGATIFREDSQKSKPNPEALLLALRELDVKLREEDVVWYVGDRHKDVLAAQETARHVPCDVVPIAYGVNAAVAIIEKGYSPEQIFMAYPDMRARLVKLLKSAATKKKTGDKDGDDEQKDMFAA